MMNRREFFAEKGKKDTAQNGNLSPSASSTPNFDDLNPGPDLLRIVAVEHRKTD